MALGKTAGAIGAVSQTLRERIALAIGAGLTVRVGRPEPASDTSTHSVLNLFLYEIHVDEFLRGESLDDGQPAPLWLVLHYLMTAFDDQGNSDTVAAHEILGTGMRALHAANFLQPTAGTLAPLQDNPNELKVTFDAAPVDLISKIMQGPDMKYRCSAAFQVRPVLIAPAEPAAYAQLVGVNYLAGGVLIGEKGIHTPVQPSLGPSLSSVSPAKFEVGAALQVTGTDLNLEGLTLQIGGVAMLITGRAPDLLRCVVPPGIAAGNQISAGSQPITAIHTLSTGRRVASDAVMGGLLPRVDTATPSSVSAGDPVSAVIDLIGILLSAPGDSVFLGLSRQGKVVRIFDEFSRPTSDQKSLRLTFGTTPDSPKIPKGAYRVILRVNGQQALNSPEITL